MDRSFIGQRLYRDNFKRLMEELCAMVREESRNPLLILHRNMIFTGNPGSGKTTAAQIAAGILTGVGAGDPVFVVPSRSDLIGRFVGDTAPKVKVVFDAARGGVLFIIAMYIRTWDGDAGWGEFDSAYEMLSTGIAYNS